MCVEIRNADTRERNCFALSLPSFVVIFHGSFTTLLFISSTADTENNGVMQGTNVFRVYLHKLNCIIFRAWCKMKMGGPCSKIIKNVKMVAADHETKHKAPLKVGTCVTTQATHHRNQPCVYKPPNRSKQQNHFSLALSSRVVGQKVIASYNS